jgi:hypothetical protein
MSGASYYSGQVAQGSLFRFSLTMVITMVNVEAAIFKKHLSMQGNI